MPEYTEFWATRNNAWVLAIPFVLAAMVVLIIALVA